MADELMSAQDCAALWNVSKSYARRVLTAVDRDPATGAISLDVRDADLGKGKAVVAVPVKESEPQAFPLSDRVFNIVREAMDGRSEGPLLVNERGKPVSRYTASQFAQAVAEVSRHAFTQRPHVLEHHTERVRMGGLQVGDVIHFNERRVTVDALKHVKTPTGGTDVQVNLGTDYPTVFGDANTKVTITARRTGNLVAEALA
ncbi:hypothetical protein AB8O64_11305 [Streptomyces sp. QH1-20]|uniref:hypothetical protein n=1 Tax=Streptomyces sp. QH1-20 TaxID=3240934 RepID=UPI0035122B08